MKIGIGYDTHVFAKNRKLILGGIEIDHPLGLAGHSDADVLIHAIMDALLGAAGLSDIGHFFPDDDPKHQGADSTALLKEILNHLKPKYRIVNVDSVILCQRPKLKEYLPSIKAKLQKIIGAPTNVKATTTEHMNAEGEGRCVSVQAVCLLEKK